MKKVKVFYPEIENMGDLLNPLIIEKLFDVKVERANSVNADLYAIGSGLIGVFESNRFFKRLLQKSRNYIFGSSVYIWGTGFINDYSQLGKLAYSNTVFKAVRGKLTKNKLNSLLKLELDIPTGDAGILADILVDGKIINKKYSVGIIPHYLEQDEKIVKDLLNHYDNACLIDLKDEPISVIEKIASCETILSSSLHGLIVADSFLIPNRHIFITNNLKGDGFKFDDYYSNYGMRDEPIILNSVNNFPTISSIVENYKINKFAVEKMKKDLVNAFPFK